MNGLCECGCGQPAPIAPQTDRRKGWVIGEPLRFVYGHRRLQPVLKTYRALTVDGERKRVHVQRAERALGKPLPPKAVVHHADGSKRDDAPLVICQDQTYHCLLHTRMRIKAAGGDPDTDAECGHPRNGFRMVKYCRDCYKAHESLRWAEYGRAKRIARRKARRKAADPHSPLAICQECAR